MRETQKGFWLISFISSFPQKMVTVEEYIAQFGEEMYQKSQSEAGVSAPPVPAQRSKSPSVAASADTADRMTMRELLEYACGSCDNCIKPNCEKCGSCKVNRFGKEEQKQCCYLKVSCFPLRWLLDY